MDKPVKKTAGQGLRAPAVQEQDLEQLGDVVLQKLMEMDRKSATVSKPILVGFIIALLAFSLVVILGIIFFVSTIAAMHNGYVQNIETVILSQASIKSASDWENFPEEQKRSRLREQYSTIIQYYTNNISDKNKMTANQIIDSFNELWRTTSKTSINFFLPVAYMKVATNFNPNYNKDQRKGITAFYLKTIDDATNLPLIREDPIFNTIYKGSDTAFSVPDMMRVLVGRINNLMALFHNREDWVLLALFTNEFDVIQKYWDDGHGVIPDDVYKNGHVAEALRYYYAFKNYKIPVLQ